MNLTNATIKAAKPAARPYLLSDTKNYLALPPM